MPGTDNMSDDLGRAPTRRSLREQRRVGEAADKARDRDPSTPDQPAADSETRSSDDTNQLERVAKANRSRRAADVPFDMVPERGERSSLQRARDREALRARREAANKEAAQRDATPADTERAADEAAPLTRRQLRLQALAAARAAGQAPSAPEDGDSTTGTAVAGAAETAEPSENATSLSVEEALEARRKTVAQQPRIQKPAVDETDADDLEVIARQRELAARAAIISRRVAERERLQRSNSERAQRPADPFTGAMNRLRIEQAERDLANTGVNAPQTNGFRLEMPEQPKPASKGKTATKTKPAGEQDRGAGAAVKPAPETASGQAMQDRATETGGQPVSARSAQGLEPLDYLTAGVRRVNAWTVAVIAALAVGAGALVTGIIMISTNG